jgi:hypothetical protein
LSGGGIGGVGDPNLDLQNKLSPYIDLEDGRRCRAVNKCSAGDDVWCPDANIDTIIGIFACIESNPQLLEGIPSLKDFHNLRLCPVMVEIQDVSRQWIEEAKITEPPVPTEIIRLADPQTEIEIRYVQLKAYHGATWRLDNCWVIHVNENEELSRRRMTIIHESFHILLHRIFSSKSKAYIVSTGIFGEILANAFAAFVLMPEEWIRKEWYKCEDISSLAKRFEVAEQTMYLRLIQLGILPVFGGECIESES